jgi:hypothetical protein
MLGALAGMIYLVSLGSSRMTGELGAGMLLGLTLVFKPVLWPLGFWALLRYRFGVVLGGFCVAVTLVTISLLSMGITPWIDYVSVLRSFGTPDRYIENQSLIGFVARMFDPDIAKVVQFVSPLVLLGWFAYFRHLPAELEIASLTGIAVLISPVAWYYYGVLLIPAFWFLATRYRESSLWFTLGLLVAYGLIQLHQVTWYRFTEESVLANLGFYGTMLLVVLAFIRAYNLNRAQRLMGGTTVG